MLTVKRAAEILNVSQGLIYALCAQGKLEHERYGLGRGTIRIREEALAQFQNHAKRASALPFPSLPGTFMHLDGERLARAWKERQSA
jgi:excisionase family DNA binding protein